MHDSKRHKPLRTLSVREAGFDEKWVQDRIYEEPGILGLGDLTPRDKEKPQPGGGRLDLLLVDPDSARRYEVEVQLGGTDASHIVRTIEYWDVERKRYPQFDHCAVIVAEDITSRFHNVIALFNGFIPLIALKLTVIDLGDEVGLLFTKVLGETEFGNEEEDEVQDPANEEYWIKKGSAETVRLCHQLHDLTKQIEPNAQLQFNRQYIGLYVNGRAFNFLTFRPRKKHVVLHLSRVAQSEEVDKVMEDHELDSSIRGKKRTYWIDVTAGDIAAKGPALLDLMRRSHKNATRE